MNLCLGHLPAGTRCWVAAAAALGAGEDLDKGLGQELDEDRDQAERPRQITSKQIPRQRSCKIPVFRAPARFIQQGHFPISSHNQPAQDPVNTAAF